MGGNDRAEAEVRRRASATASLPDPHAAETRTDEWLAPTRYCDWHHPAIRRVAAEVTSGAGSERAAAVRLFRFVRDHVLYTFGPWGVPASHTLAHREGTCTNKNNLLVALLRAIGIRAGYGVLRVNGKEYFGSIAPEYFKHIASDDSTHVYAAVLLEGSWVKCDASTDRAMAEKTAHFCRQTALIEWDGAHDGVDFLEPAHIHTDLGLRPNVDDLLDKPPRNANPAAVALLNDYVRYIRRHPPFPSAADLIAAYRSQRLSKNGRDR
jgi:transglutaminase-like putative cysteine protease